MDEATARTDIRVREAEKVHSIRFFPQGRGAKKKDPNCIQIRVLLWSRWWDWVEPDCFLYPAQAAQPVQAQRWARSALLAELP